MRDRKNYLNKFTTQIKFVGKFKCFASRTVVVFAMSMTENNVLRLMNTLDDNFSMVCVLHA